MATIINKPACESKYGNLGKPSCAVKLTKLLEVFIAPPAFYIPAASLTDIDTAVDYLRDATFAANPMNRVYPLGVIDFTDNTAAPEKKTTANYGISVGHVKSNPTFEIQFNDYGIDFFENISQFNDLVGWQVFLGDKTFIGGKETALGFKGLEMSMFTKMTWGNKANPNMYKADIDFVDEDAIITMDALPLATTFVYSDTFKGLLDVVLTATGGVGEIEVSVVTKISNTDLVGIYPTDIIDATVFVVKDSTGATVTTASSLGTGGDTVIITGSAGALSAGVYTVQLAVPLVLETAGIGGGQSEGFESNIVSATVTA